MTESAFAISSLTSGDTLVIRVPKMGRLRPDGFRFSLDGRRALVHTNDGAWALDVETRQWVEGAAEAESTRARSFDQAWEAVARGDETVIRQVVSGQEIAWFPASLSEIVAHPTRLMWAGAEGNHLHILKANAS